MLNPGFLLISFNLPLGQNSYIWAFIEARLWKILLFQPANTAPIHFRLL
jgi:hypothetical protein